MFGLLSRFNRREHAAVYGLASLSNLLLSIPEYLAVRTAAESFLPLQGISADLISTYGVNLGLFLDLLWTSAVFQVVLVAPVLSLAACTIPERKWRVLYIFSGMFLSGFTGYWLSARFLRTLGWVSILENSGVQYAGVYSDTFWLGLGSAASYVAMILVLRRAYDRLVIDKTDTFRGRN